MKAKEIECVKKNAKREENFKQLKQTEKKLQENKKQLFFLIHIRFYY
jgi:hypothetical protein